MTTPVPGPPASVLSSILVANPADNTGGLMSVAVFSGSGEAAFLPSLMNDVVAMPKDGLADDNFTTTGYLSTLGLTGAIAPTRWVGATFSGAPTAGTFAAGDFVISQDGNAYVCTVAGSPGTWVKSGGTPSGTASGDLSGTYPGPSVANAHLAAQSINTTATLGASSAPVVLTDTTSAAFTLTLPATPVANSMFVVVDDTGQWAAHNLTIGRNGKNIDGTAAGLTLTNQWGKVWLYYDGTQWWSLANGLSNETPVTDGTASAGSHNSGSRADHAHPTDTSRLAATAAASGDLSGNYPGPTVAKIGGTAFSLPASIANGGTGQATQQAAMNALAGAQTSAQFLRGNGTNVVMAAIQAGDVPTLNQNTTGSAGSFTGNLAGDVTGTQAATSVGKVQGVAVTAAQATLLSQMNNATTRSATATVLAGEETVFTGSTAAQTLTLPASPQASTINTVLNLASVSVTLAAGAGGTINSFGTSGSLTLAPNALVQAVFIGTTWYVIDTNNAGNAVGTLAIGNGGTGQTGAAAAYNALSPMTTLGDIEYESGASTAARLAGNTSATKNFLTQTGTGTVSAAPAWGTIASGDLPAATTGAQGAVKLPAASVNYKPTNPTSTTSATELMMGLGSSTDQTTPLTYTPTGSGKVIAWITAYVTATGGAANITCDPRYGTGTAPLNAAALTGTAFGNGGAGSGVHIGGSANILAVAFTDRLSLTAGTAYWFDIALATSANTGAITNISVTLAEQLA